MRVEEERRKAERQQGCPEVDEPRTPNGDRSEDQHHQSTCAEVDGRSSEARVENAERNASSGKTTTGTDVTGTTE